MGVTGLWTVVAPTARPTKLETLNRKRLAVDASIWIYQFLKAVRDKEGNALRNSHVVGFFRRICKLLYFGIKPVFVFDGGAPILKRETVRGRRQRREGRREDAARTAGKLLALQMTRAAEEEEKRRKSEHERTPDEEELPADQELVYVDELGMNQKERQAGRGFRRKDQYHLPDLDISIETMGAPNDPRIMSQAELEDYARQFHSGEEVSFYDFSKIDFESPFFLSLPPGDRYNILNAARLRSRLRMGHSKEQLDAMFPDRMAFSKFQIERVKERNELTQRLMHLNGGTDELNLGGRIAGEKGREYVLVKNEGVEGGWALGVVSNKQGAKRENAIDLEEDEQSEMEGLSSDSEDDFEDVAIEGLNRIPKQWQRKHKEIDSELKHYDATEEIARKRRSVYAAREAAAAGRDHQPVKHTQPVADDGEGLFVRQDSGIAIDEDDELFEDVEMAAAQSYRHDEEEDDDLELAVAMSLQQQDSDHEVQSGGFLVEESADRQPPHERNVQANAPNRVEEDDDDFDLQAALAESRKSMHKSKTLVQFRSPQPSTQNDISQSAFGGVLPFESLNLGQSLLGKKKLKKIDEGLSGGFDKSLGEDVFRKQRPAQPIPSWFEAAPKTNDLRNEDYDAQEDTSDDLDAYGRKDRHRDWDGREALIRHQTNEVIDLEAPENSAEARVATDEPDTNEDDLLIHGSFRDPSMEDPESQDPSQSEQEQLRKKKQEEERERRYELAQAIADANEEAEGNTRMEQIAEHVQVKPPPPSSVPNFVPDEVIKDIQISPEEPDEEASVEWSDSEPDETTGVSPVAHQPTEGHFLNDRRDSADNDDEDEGEFEDVPASGSFDPPPALSKEQSSMNAADIAMTSQYIMEDPENDEASPSANISARSPNAAQAQEEYLSDSEEELMRQLAVEAEEHARFASSLNTSKTPAEAARDYESELKQLRNQQAKDRRDADEVTQVMVQECQALLRLFGLPYITAPMEAEAQCAELVQLGLVDGIVTDDSDIFLFGGTRVYKNMFNAAKFVECYLSSDLEKEYALTREKLIRFAHLLGSDYTEGIPGVGPVTALEILTDFRDLSEFKQWCARVQLGRPQDLEEQLTTPFRRKFRNTAQKRLFLPTTFPDIRVDQAYLKPDVDSDPQEFQWGVPDLDKLRSFLMATIGWGQERTDEILVPVVRDMNRREVEGTQANITRFFSGAVGIGAAGKEAAGSRNNTGRESGRMARAYKTLRREAERKRRGRSRTGDVGVDADLDQNSEDSAADVIANPNATATNGNHRKTSATKSKVAKGRRRRKAAAAAAADSSGAEAEDGEDSEPKGANQPRKRQKKAAVDVEENE